MTAAPGPRQPDEEPMRYPVGRPYWLGIGQPWNCDRCMTSQDADAPHPCPSVVCPEHGVEHDPDRPAAPPAQPNREHICLSCGFRGRHGPGCPTQPDRDTKGWGVSGKEFREGANWCPCTEPGTSGADQ